VSSGSESSFLASFSASEPGPNSISSSLSSRPKEPRARGAPVGSAVRSSDDLDPICRAVPIGRGAAAGTPTEDRELFRLRRVIFFYFIFFIFIFSESE
jgi:hypothetical protein